MSDKADIKELAVAAWRLEKWLNNLNADRKMAAKSALRSIKKYIAASGVEVKDPVGAKFDPGLAVEVVNNEAEEAAEEALIIKETLVPYVYQNGELIQYARVIIGTDAKNTSNNEAFEESCFSDNEDILSESINKANDETAIVSEQQTPSKEEADLSANDQDIQISKNEMEKVMAYAKIL